jgi:hypothetical protein
MSVSPYAHEGLGHAPDDVLNGNGQLKIGGRDANFANHVRLQQAKALPHAHGQTQHHGSAAKDHGHMESGQVGLFHASDYFQTSPIDAHLSDTGEVDSPSGPKP